MHLGIDAQTLQIRAIAVTTINEVGDSPMAADLLGQIPSNEEIASFTGDGAYDTQDVHKACPGGAIPIIPPRKGAKLRKGLAFAHRNEAVKACRQLGGLSETLERLPPKVTGGDQDELLQATRREGQRARTFERQVTELHIRASILNQFTALGTPQTVAAA